jgi:hypothetical protein
MRDDLSLTRCKGYRDDTHDGRIGSVAAVLPRTGLREYGVLIVRSGLLSCTLFAVAFGQVERVDVERRRILLRKELPQTMREAARPRARDRIASRA